jgi:hypothetical protein
MQATKDPTTYLKEAVYVSKLLKKFPLLTTVVIAPYSGLNKSNPLPPILFICHLF